jgi:dTDP-4-amino-4,6-dideoxygalactose transaminase
MLLLGHYGRLKKGQAHGTFDSDYLSLGVKYRPHLFAILLAQGSLRRLPELNRRRQANYDLLFRELEGCAAIQPIETTPGAVRGGFLEYILRYEPDHAGGMSQADFIAAAKAEGVPVAPERYSSIGKRGRQLHESPIFTDPAAFGVGSGAFGATQSREPLDQLSLPVTESLKGRLLTLPPFTKVPSSFVRECAQALRKVADAGALRQAATASSDSVPARELPAGRRAPRAAPAPRHPSPRGGD